MRHFALAAALAAAAPLVLAPIAPAAAQSPRAEARWQQAQRDYQIATDRYNAERDRYMAARNYDRGGYGYGAPPPPPPGSYPGGYGAPPPPPPPPGGGYYGDADPTYQTDYDASRYYRDGPGYQERTLAANDQVYRGSDGRYYCKRNDGTTGLIVGGAAGGILGNVIDGGHHRAAGTLIGVAVGALAGKAVDQSSSPMRCR